MSDFEIEVKNGLSASPKTLPTKYFYDAKGCVIFQEIMKLEEYYLPECEQQIINNASTQLGAEIRKHCAEIELVELGAGDGIKTVELIKAFKPLFQTNQLLSS